MISLILAMAVTQTPSLCEEVAHELNNQYVEGYISREAATRIIDRCFLMEHSDK